MKGHNPYKNTPDNHDFMEKDHIARFLRNDGTGVDNLGRRAVSNIVRSYGNPTVLDIACGTAVNWEVFKKFDAPCKYTGLDRTKNLLAHAKELYGSEISLVEGYAQSLPFEDNSVDVVIIRHLLEHLQEGYEYVIEEALRVTKKELVIVFFLDLIRGEDDRISESRPDENGCTYFWNEYSHSKFMRFVSSLRVRPVVAYVRSPGAAHADTIFRFIK
jgi:ubiquinone/menaquinone biosynthesis C-methylase UbiE